MTFGNVNASNTAPCSANGRAIGVVGATMVRRSEKRNISGARCSPDAQGHLPVSPWCPYCVLVKGLDLRERGGIRKTAPWLWRAQVRRQNSFLESTPAEATPAEVTPAEAVLTRPVRPIIGAADYRCSRLSVQSTNRAQRRAASGERPFQRDLRPTPCRPRRQCSP